MKSWKRRFFRCLPIGIALFTLLSIVFDVQSRRQARRREEERWQEAERLATVELWEEAVQRVADDPKLLRDDAIRMRAADWMRRSGNPQRALQLLVPEEAEGGKFSAPHDLLVAQCALDARREPVAYTALQRLSERSESLSDAEQNTLRACIREWMQRDSETVVHAELLSNWLDMQQKRVLARDERGYFLLNDRGGDAFRGRRFERLLPTETADRYYAERIREQGGESSETGDSGRKVDALESIQVDSNGRFLAFTKQLPAEEETTLVAIRKKLEPVTGAMTGVAASSTAESVEPGAALPQAKIGRSRDGAAWRYTFFGGLGETPAQFAYATDVNAHGGAYAERNGQTLFLHFPMAER